ncbi:unnamed protein product [Pseudo-nitzschia multistriata]|uniref:PH domain-containing protein n=1 Tax=Pseudo-nitzschia multistriata TaxID=183589 RepID=A0A448ZE36_9STRA|nr:unnamed protein product [Pseudo-nitzschia multistriata]
MISAPSATHAILMATILATSTSAFQSPPMTSTSSSSVISIDREVESLTSSAPSVPQTKDYAVANHDNERSFWLQALQNLDDEQDDSHDSSSSSEPSHSMWTRIACAFAPSSIRENYLLDPTQTLAEEAHLVRVGDTNLDISMAVPASVWKEANLDEMMHTNQKAQRKDSAKLVSAPQEAAPLHQRGDRRKRRNNQHTVTIRIDFPEGSSFDKDAYTFEDELSAVIRQVRLLEHDANDRLSGLEMAH